MSKMEKVVEACKRRAIIFPTAEIYGGTSGFFEYGPIGALLKRKFENYWREHFIKSEDNIVEIEGCVVLPKVVWEASGHLEGFVDPLTQCKSCMSIHRADHLVQSATGKFVEGLSPEKLTEIIKEENLKCPSCKGELSEVRLFNMMLGTIIGPVEGQEAHLRPETAQNTFTNFRRVFKAMRAKLPFGIAQLGRSFRNEISPRHFVVRVREFGQLEIEMFLDPERLDECPKFDEVADTEITIYTREAQEKGKKPIRLTAREAFEKKIIPNKYMAYFLAKEFLFFQSLGIPKEALRFRHLKKEETPHYSKANFDLEIKFEFGWCESVGNAYRSDYDLKRHMQYSKQDLTVMTPDGRKVIPHVVEPSFGVERPIAGLLLHCFQVGKERGWSWFKFPAKIAPYAVAVFPLVNKDGLPEKAREVYKLLKSRFDVFYDGSGSIGRRYARADDVGTFLAVTIDYQTLDDQTVTIRNRDTTEQIRAEIGEIKCIIDELLGGKPFEKVDPQRPD